MPLWRHRRPCKWRWWRTGGATRTSTSRSPSQPVPARTCRTCRGRRFPASPGSPASCRACRSRSRARQELTSLYLVSSSASRARWAFTVPIRRSRRPHSAPAAGCVTRRTWLWPTSGARADSCASPARRRSTRSPTNPSLPSHLLSEEPTRRTGVCKACSVWKERQQSFPFSATSQHPSRVTKAPTARPAALRRSGRARPHWAASRRFPRCPVCCVPRGTSAGPPRAISSPDRVRPGPTMASRASTTAHWLTRDQWHPRR